MSTWIFLRHGQSTGNLARTLTGHTDLCLTPLGREQARRASQILAEVKINQVISSDLRRARETAALATRDRMPIQLDAALRERHMGSWEEAPLAQVRADGRMLTLMSWRGRPPGGESLADLARRVSAALARHDGPGTTLVVTHAGVIRACLALIDELPRDQVGTLRVAHATPVFRGVPEGTWAAWARTEAGTG